MFKCSDIESRVIEILEGNLDPVDSNAVETHTRDCTECRNLLAHYQPLFKNDTASQTPAPETLWRSLQNRLDQFDEGRPIQPTLFPKRRPLLGYALQTLAIATAIVVGVILGKMPETETSFEDEIVSYYAGALTQTALPIEEVLEQVSQGQGGDR